ncbi:Fimbrial subunit type 1 precursor [Arcanobacterium haemolyticum]|uniref:SpaH/EbpB family LPXTG-anchored major pilin n=1 Tax=Arcanobacterium haemolyticum TaxID=28264 RepID=UPI000D9A4035|nr:SpaH/EbpB family LPXTG-anchored major pilin [Arcanobacterium haemolyticum]SPT75409.1 Fimbrial subunit type 1 precursor [Arcanobacterium haemolyticum]
MNIKTTKLGRMGALVTALTLASVGAATAASADNTKGFDLPDKSQPVSLTIHKHEGDSQQLGEYTGQKPSGLGNPVKGVEFTIQKVGTMVDGSCVAPDLATPKSWVAIKSATVDNVCDLNKTTQKVETEENGSVKVDHLEQGLYKVTETDSGPNVVATKSVPFLVTLPMPLPSNKWDYDVHAYPKNKLVENPGKDLKKDAGKPDKPVPGASIDWTIKVTLPGVALPYTEISLTDTIPAGLQFSQVKSFMVDNTELIKGEDFTNDATIKLTKKGLEKVNKLVVGNDKAGKTFHVSVVLQTKVTEEITGKVENKVTLSLNGKTTEASGATFWGTVEVKKIDENGQTITSPAKFAIFEGQCKNVTSSTEPVAKELKTINGKISQTLYVGKSEADTAHYCVKETAAPAGYLLDNSGEDIELSASGWNVDIEYKNVKVTGPNLPLTGAQGTALLTGVGLLLLTAGAGTVYVVRRRDV